MLQRFFQVCVYGLGRRNAYEMSSREAGDARIKSKHLVAAQPTRGPQIHLQATSAGQRRRDANSVCLLHCWIRSLVSTSALSATYWKAR